MNQAQTLSDIPTHAVVTLMLFTVVPFAIMALDYLRRKSDNEKDLKP